MYDCFVMNQSYGPNEYYKGSYVSQSLLTVPVIYVLAKLIRDMVTGGAQGARASPVFWEIFVIGFFQGVKGGVQVEKGDIRYFCWPLVFDAFTGPLLLMY